MKVQKCCCCVNLEIGVFILGCLVWFSLLGEITWFNPIRATITLCTGILFCLVVFDDSEKHRKYFFYSYIVHTISDVVFGIHQIYAQLEETHFVENKCLDM